MRRLIAEHARHFDGVPWKDVLLYAVVWLVLGFFLGLAAHPHVRALFFE